VALFLMHSKSIYKSVKFSCWVNVVKAETKSSVGMIKYALDK